MPQEALREVRERQAVQDLRLRKAINDATETIASALAALKDESDRRKRDRAQCRELAQHLDHRQRTVVLLHDRLGPRPPAANGAGQLKWAV